MSKTGEVIGSDITHSSVLAKNTLWNTLGLVLPLVVGLFSMPFLVHGLGAERFGVLTIAWMVIGYFSILDFGLGRALTQIVAKRLGENDHESIPPLIWTGMGLMACTGVIGAIALGLVVDVMVHRWLNIEQSLQQESLNAFYILSVSIPFIVITSGFRGVLEAYQKFFVVNVIRIPLGLLTFLGPLIVLPVSNELDMIVLILLAGRIVGAYAYYYYCIKSVPALGFKPVLDRKTIKPLLSFGGWMSVSNLLGPLMVYLDRFLIGSVLTMTAVSYYVAPYEIVTKLWMIPMGLLGVLFPAFSTMLASDRPKIGNYFTMGTNIILFSMFPLFFSINLFASEGLGLWLGDEFSIRSSTVLQWLSAGVLVNCVSRVASVFVLGVGRPDLLAKLFLFELPLYIGALWYALNYFGIEGVAAIWALRVFIDAGAFFALVAWIAPELSKRLIIVSGQLLISLLLLFMATLIVDLSSKILLLIIVLVMSAILTWKSGIVQILKKTLLPMNLKA